MKRALMFLLLVCPMAIFCGCSEMSPDDREFYGRGWIHPTDLDQVRPTKMPAHPETTGSLGTGPVAGNSESGEEWAAPQRY